MVPVNVSFYPSDIFSKLTCTLTSGIILSVGTGDLAGGVRVQTGRGVETRKLTPLYP